MRLPTLDVVGEVVERVDDLAVFGDLEMQVRAAAHTGRAGNADDLPLGNIVAHADRAGGQVLIGRGVAAAVAHDNVVAAVLVVRRDDDGARLGGDGLRRVAHAADVDARVVRRRARDARVARAERRGDVSA